MAKERKQKQPEKRERMIPATFTCDSDLLVQIEDRAKAMDMNRSQYLRKLAREDLGIAAA